MKKKSLSRRTLKRIIDYLIFKKKKTEGKHFKKSSKIYV